VILEKPLRIAENKHGFTLLELMVIVAIIGIMATFAAANIIDFIPRYHVKSAARQIRAELQKAKMEAVKRNEPCLVTFTAGNPGSFRTCFNSTNGSCTDAGDQIFTDFDMTEYPNVQIDRASFTSGVSYFWFNSRGMPMIGSNWSAGSITIGCGNGCNYSLTIDLAASGRVQIE